MEIPNGIKIFIGLIVIFFMIAIFWLTSWQNYDKQIKEEQEEIMQVNNEIQQVFQQKEEIPKLNAQITQLQKELLQIKTKTITDLNDVKKPLVKKQKQIIEQKKQQQKK